MATVDIARHQRALMEGLYAMFKDGVMTDVTLEVEHEEIHCHRNVLAAASPYFRAMFTNPVKERDERIIKLHDVEAITLRDVVDYIYTGEIKVNNENVQELIVAANMFELEHLIDQCANHMSGEICVNNCIDIYQFASHFACLSLKQNAKMFILDHFLDVLHESNKITSLNADEMEDIISSDELGVESEETVYDVIVKWSEEGDRDAHIPRLFNQVRLPLINENFFYEHIDKNVLLRADRKCRRVLNLYKSYTVRASTDDTKADVEVLGKQGGTLRDIVLNDTPRHGMFNKTVLVFSSGANGTDQRSLTAFDPFTLKNYIALQPHPTFDFKFKVDYFQLVTTSENNILFIGGIFYDNHHFEDLGTALKDVYMYNMKEVRWDKMAGMTTARCWFSASVYRDSVYVIGGKPTYPRGDPTDSVEMYNIVTDVWTPVSSLPIKLYGHSSCVAKDAIFAFGGKDEDDDFLDTVFRYDIASDSWALVTTQMPKPKAMLSSFFYNDSIFLIGGIALYENIMTVSIYKPDRNIWTHGADFPEERKIVAAAFHKGTIFVCGGVHHLGVTGRRTRQIEARDLYKYDITKDTWTKVVKLVQYGNPHSLTVAILNTKYLQESDFVSNI